MKKKVLILGNSANAYSLAKELSKDCEVYIAPGSSTTSDFANNIDIRENSAKELLEFVLENGIDLTIPVSAISINSDTVNLFNQNNQQVFGPVRNAANIVLDKAWAKKILYKLRVPTPKFGIFEKQAMAADYIKNINEPYLIKTNEPSSAVILTSQKESKPILDTVFNGKSQKVIIEEYIWGSPFSFYAITDGYKALPIGSAITHKHSLDGEGGQLTSGMGSVSPNYKLSIENEYFLMDNIIYPTLEYLENGDNAYTGIIGINGILTPDNKMFIIGYNNFIQDCDCPAILSLVDMNLYNLFESCAIGSFSDEVDSIPLKNASSVSVVLKCNSKNNPNNIITGLDNINDDTIISFYPNINKNKYLEYEASYGTSMVVTTLGRTAASAANKAYEEINCLNFNGISYRKDICKPITSEL